MIRDYPEYGHDWEIYHGGYIGTPYTSGMCKWQLGIGMGYHLNGGSRLDYFQGSDGWNHSWNIDLMNRSCLHDPYGVSMNYEQCGICTVGVCPRNSVIIVQGSR